MLLENNFYKIHEIRDDEGIFTFKVELLSEHPVYAGHFPGRPVVPGVCTLTIIKECLSKILGHEVTFSVIKECKYITVLFPTDIIDITLDITITELINLKATVMKASNRQIALKLRAIIK